MSPERIAFLQNLAAVIGVLILAVPAFSLDLRKKALFRIDRIIERRREMGDASALDAVAQELRDDRAARVTNWRRIDRICLYVGYHFVLGAAISRLIW
ncbi:MAG TPA: hypothetical protein VK022_01850 [Paracoccaceae bacterium]|nr:hypothetical protein [Paracoccaceae bacterium]